MLNEKLLVDMKAMEGKRVLIIGDVGLDEYITGHVHRISPEAPVPVLDVEGEEERMGLSANVAQNILSLGGVPDLISVVGNDEGAEKLSRLILKAGMKSDGFLTDSSRPTTRKTRVMTEHHHIVRVDYEKRHHLSAETESKLLAKVQAGLDKCDIVVLQDYAKGVISAPVSHQIFMMAKAKGKRVLVDPHRTNPLGFYKGCDLIKPNYQEAFALVGMSLDETHITEETVVQVGRLLQEKTQAKQVVLTRGKEGMTIFDGSEIHKVPTYAQRVFDVTGAGDTVIATLALAQAAGVSLVESCQLANAAAGVVVAKVGCVPCEKFELEAALHTVGFSKST
ncbi:MAG: D-glycero-beta-D-manno-heptose-7-phosphate kinase [Bdellovibrionota bacterium]